MNHLTGDAGYERRLASEQPPRALGNDVEHGLHIGRRAGDDIKDFCSYGLPLQRNRKLVLQADVLGCAALQLLF